MLRTPTHESIAADLQAERPAEAGAWSESARRILEERYLWKDANGKVIESPDEMCWRVARAVAEAEANYCSLSVRERYMQVRTAAKAFYSMLVQHEFLPNSPTLMNAGKGNNLQLSACYVLPVEDSLEGIFTAVKHAALVHKSGGGTGMSFSRLRSKGSLVGSTKGVASGPVSFLKVFDGATEAVKQGSMRRGANMGILRVDHPDIEEFIDCKRSGGITNFNISVGITNEFMQAYVDDEEYFLTDPGTPDVRAGTRSARDIMARIIDAAWATGDPGLFFIDRANASRANPVPGLEDIEATNPCGEQPLGPFDACNLGSINLGKFVRSSNGGRVVDWERLEATTRLAVRFLDDVIDINPYPLPEIEAKVRANRRIGLGVMGWADLLLALGLRYDSEEAITLGTEVMSRIQGWAEDESAILAVTRGPFPNWEHSIYRNGVPLRNSNRTTVAPTGSISILADCSSGIEPLFALAFQHKVKQPDGSVRVLDFVHPHFKEALDRAMSPGDAHDEVAELVRVSGSLHAVDWAHLHGWGIPGIGVMPTMLVPFVTAHEIKSDWHIRMQAAFQKGVDSAISKTVNLPADASRADVEACYHLAWELGCMGITIFRDGCKGEQVLNRGVVEASARPAPERQLLALPPAPDVKPRPVVLFGETYQMGAPEGKVNVTLNGDEAGLMEVFINVGKAGSDIAALAEALGRLISLVLRVTSPIPPNERAREVADQLRGIGGSRTIGFGPGRVRSMPDAVAIALERYLGDDSDGINEGVLIQQAHAMLGGNNLCPDCGNHTLRLEEGCAKCASCGHSEC